MIPGECIDYMLMGKIHTIANYFSLLIESRKGHNNPHTEAQKEINEIKKRDQMTRDLPRNHLPS
jgi:hypothetical protein